MSDLGLPEVNPLDVKGDIITAGSSTVFPLSEAVAERFHEEGYAGQHHDRLDRLGCGLRALLQDGRDGHRECEPGDQGLRESETVPSIGRTPIEFRVGTDALAVVVNPANDWLKDVTLEELAKIFSKDTMNWSDVNPAWPKEPIKRFSPGTDRGTFDYFVEAVMDKAYVKDATADKGKGEEALLGAANLQLSEDDNVLVQGVEGDKNAIGYFGFAYFKENEGKLQGSGDRRRCAEPGDRGSGKYPLARPLFIYSDAKIMQDKPQVADFINFYLTQCRQRDRPGGLLPGPGCGAPGLGKAWLDAMK